MTQPNEPNLLTDATVGRWLAGGRILAYSSLRTTRCYSYTTVILWPPLLFAWHRRRLVNLTSRHRMPLTIITCAMYFGSFSYAGLLQSRLTSRPVSNKLTPIFNLSHLPIPNRYRHNQELESVQTVQHYLHKLYLQR